MGGLMEMPVMLVWMKRKQRTYLRAPGKTIRQTTMKLRQRFVKLLTGKTRNTRMIALW
jgi:cytochrome c2